MGTGIEVLSVYTDGGCSGNPGPGGWAYVIIRAESGDVHDESAEILAEKWGAEESTTNNRMELQAVIAALEELGRLNLAKEGATLYTDSQYVQKGMTLWIKEWKKKGWRTSAKAPVKNQDLWQRLDSLAAGLSINWAWVRGHAGNKFNERCDFLTGEAIGLVRKQA